MVRGYCTLFLIKIDLWSRGALPIDRSPWSMDGVSSWVGGVGEILFRFVNMIILT